MVTTPHLGLTLVESSQAQKEVTVNMALMRIDALLNAGANNKDLTTPPASPIEGDMYIVAASASGEWAGKEGQIAYFEQIWRFIEPNTGLMLWVNDESQHYYFDGVSWNPYVPGSTTGVVQTYTKQQNFGAATLTDGANISWDLDDAQTAKVTLSGNRTLDNPTNMVDGGTYILRVTQDGTGGRTLAYGSAYKWPGGTVPTLSTAANAIDILTFVSDGTNMYGVAQQEFS